MGCRDAELISLRVEKELYDKLEDHRENPHSKILLNRTDVYLEVLFYGEKILQIKKEMGEKEFDKVWNIITKLNLNRANLEKFL
jgi:hypothetical protein